MTKRGEMPHVRRAASFFVPQRALVGTEFEAARKQLLEAVQKQRQQVKTHTVLPHGRITKLFAEEGYGFLEDLDGLQVYFHRNAVLNDQFDVLSVGSFVRFVLAQGEGKEGPQASTVELVEP